MNKKQSLDILDFDFILLLSKVVSYHHCISIYLVFLFFFFFLSFFNCQMMTKKLKQE